MVFTTMTDDSLVCHYRNGRKKERKEEKKDKQGERQSYASRSTASEDSCSYAPLIGHCGASLIGFSSGRRISFGTA